MKDTQAEQKTVQPFMKGYKIERNYGEESLKSCVVQIIRMVVAQNMHDEQKVVL